MDSKGEIKIYQLQDGQTTIDVRLENETVWLNRNQIATLFDRDVKTIGKHINNALKEELEGEGGCVKIDTLSFFAQSPDFLKPGLCYFLKFLYL